jgi:hypothetical protein
MFVHLLETAILGGLFKKPGLGGANSRKGQRPQLRDDKGRMDGGLGLREHLHGDWPPTSNPSISSLTTCPTPDESIFSEEYDHPFYVTTPNVIMLVESDVERYSIISVFGTQRCIRPRWQEERPIRLACDSHEDQLAQEHSPSYPVFICLNQHLYTLSNVTYSRRVGYQTWSVCTMRETRVFG